MTGPGVRSCTCAENYVGDGFKCKSTVDKIMDITLKGRGPFTVFVPSTQATKNTSLIRVSHSEVHQTVPDEELHKETFANLLRNHIVMCHTLLPDDLNQPRNLTSLSGLVLTTSSTQVTNQRTGAITINEANVTKSDDISVNGIIHEIDTVLFLPNINRNNIWLIPDPTKLNLTDVAERHGYKTFYKLLKDHCLDFIYSSFAWRSDGFRCPPNFISYPVFQDTGVMDLINDAINQPVTIFMPSDDAMASLPQQQKDFLFHQHNRPQLLEYLKYHIMMSQKVYAEELIYLESGRTLQGSALSFSCGGLDKIVSAAEKGTKEEEMRLGSESVIVLVDQGEIYVNDGSCRIIQRHLVFKAGIAYGIDCLLIPPSLGGRCDEQTFLDLKVSL
ncbi:hypothetical protein GOODEAATRI_016086 [Goodea atripinnis]|uniref:FAS1 domain-containing protein n=1 Tax=Goodea atripinnis TaxID=208336 RepID=A0ABV0N1V0_9TELE